MQLSDSGVYTCVARSQAGLAELTYEVQVQGTTETYYHLISPIPIGFILSGRFSYWLCIFHSAPRC